MTAPEFISEMEKIFGKSVVSEDGKSITFVSKNHKPNPHNPESLH